MQAAAGVSARPCRRGQKMTSERTRIKNKGRDSKSYPFIRLHKRVVDCPAWLSLKGNAIKVFVDIVRLYNGVNNGYIGYSYATARKRFKMSQHTVQKALNELTEKGFIEPVKRGVYRGNTKEWRILRLEDEEGGVFVELLKHIIDSPAWLSLSGSAVKVFIDIARLYNGTNNGRIKYAYSTAQTRLKMSQHTVQKALNELTEKGFLKPVQKGSHRSNATEWRITYWRDNTTKRPPSNEWKKYE